jgi:hypothetical protein
LDHKREMLDKTEEAELGDYKTYFENEAAQELSDLKAQAAAERETKNILYFSDDDIRFASYMDMDYFRDDLLIWTLFDFSSMNLS